MTEMQQVRLFRMMESYVGGVGQGGLRSITGFPMCRMRVLHRVQILVLREETMPT